MTRLLDPAPTDAERACAKEVLLPLPYCARPDEYIARLIAASRAHQLERVRVLLDAWVRAASDYESAAVALDSEHGEGTPRALQMRQLGELLGGLAGDLDRALAVLEGT